MIVAIREWVVAITRTVRIVSVAVTTTDTVTRADTIRTADMEALPSIAIMEGPTMEGPIMEDQTGAVATMATATMKEKIIAAEIMAGVIVKNARGGIAQPTRFHHGLVMKMQREEDRGTSLIVAKDLGTIQDLTNESKRISTTD
jgi:hypothetical protein